MRVIVFTQGASSLRNVKSRVRSAPPCMHNLRVSGFACVCACVASSLASARVDDQFNAIYNIVCTAPRSDNAQLVLVRMAKTVCQSQIDVAYALLKLWDVEGEFPCARMASTKDMIIEKENTRRDAIAGCTTHTRNATHACPVACNA